MKDKKECDVIHTCLICRNKGKINFLEYIPGDKEKMIICPEHGKISNKWYRDIFTDEWEEKMFDHSVNAKF